MVQRFDYRELDNPDFPVRICLNSTVVRAQHSDAGMQGDVRVTYVRDGAAYAATGRKVVMAGYHQMFPHVRPDLPKEQSQALANACRAPLVYSNVLIRKWTSFVKLGLRYAYCPGSYHHNASLDYPVSLGDYRCPTSPEEPMILHMTRVPTEPGLSAKQQFEAGRRDLLTTSFEPDDWRERDRSWLRARTRVGNIAFAGTDAASNAMTEAAIEEAHRAISDLIGS